MGGLYGCEYIRALYELGIRKFPMIEDKLKFLDEIKYTPIKLKDVPLISEKEYEEYDKILEDGYVHLFIMETKNPN